MTLAQYNAHQEKRIGNMRTLLEHGETGESLREKIIKSIKRKRWKSAEKVMAIMDAERCIAEAVKRHYAK